MVALVSLIVGVGVYAYTKHQDTSNVSADASSTSSKNSGALKASSSQAKTLTEDEQILEAAKCSNTASCTIANKQATLAHVVVGGEEGGAHIFLAKESGKWAIIYEGNGDVPAATVQKYSIPEDWLGPQL